MRGNRKCRDGAVAPPKGKFKAETTLHGEKTDLVNALESHWENDMLRTAV